MSVAPTVVSVGAIPSLVQAALERGDAEIVLAGRREEARAWLDVIAQRVLSADELGPRPATRYVRRDGMLEVAGRGRVLTVASESQSAASAAPTLAIIVNPHRWRQLGVADALTLGAAKRNGLVIVAVELEGGRR